MPAQEPISNGPPPARTVDSRRKERHRRADDHALSCPGLAAQGHGHVARESAISGMPF
jgi:hypothetical protein